MNIRAMPLYLFSMDKSPFFGMGIKAKYEQHLTNESSELMLYICLGLQLLKEELAPHSLNKDMIRTCLSSSWSVLFIICRLHHRLFVGLMTTSCITVPLYCYTLSYMLWTQTGSKSGTDYVVLTF